ncbi:hypothetical protein OK016_08880 [Vibrio chagasii]|nr:hypothetical protein [Vibrio chagasii]
MNNCSVKVSARVDQDGVLAFLMFVCPLALRRIVTAEAIKRSLGSITVYILSSTSEMFEFSIMCQQSRRVRAPDRIKRLESFALMDGTRLLPTSKSRMAISSPNRVDGGVTQPNTVMAIIVLQGFDLGKYRFVAQSGMLYFAIIFIVCTNDLSS